MNNFITGIEFYEYLKANNINYDIARDYLGEATRQEWIEYTIRTLFDVTLDLIDDNTDTELVLSNMRLINALKKLY